MISTDTTNQNSRQNNELLLNFNYNKKHGDNNSINKSEAISIRMDQKWSKPQQRLIIAVSAVVLPIIGGVIAYLAMRHSAKVDFNNVLAKKKLELLGPNGEIGKFIAQIKTSDLENPKSSLEATRIIRYDLTQTVFYKYFKQSHVRMIVNSAPPITNDETSATKNWKSFKKNYEEKLFDVNKLKCEVRKKHNLSYKQLETLLCKPIANSEANSMTENQNIFALPIPSINTHTQTSQTNPMSMFCSLDQQVEILNRLLKQDSIDTFVDANNIISNTQQQVPHNFYYKMREDFVAITKTITEGKKQEILDDIKATMLDQIALERAQFTISKNSDLQRSIREVVTQANNYNRSILQSASYELNAFISLNDQNIANQDIAFREALNNLIQQVDNYPAIKDYFTRKVPVLKDPTHIEETQASQMTYREYCTHVNTIFSALDEISLQSSIAPFQNCVSITSEQLPILPTVSQEAIRILHSHRINGALYRESPDFTSIANNFTALLGDNEEKTAYKKLFSTQVLPSVIKLYQDITQDITQFQQNENLAITNNELLSQEEKNQKINQNNVLTKEKKNTLWVLLQSALSQTCVSPLKLSGGPWLNMDNINFTPGIQQPKDAYTTYDYKNNSLDITLYYKNTFSRVHENVIVPAPFYLFTAVKMTIDLTSEDLTPHYTMPNFEIRPISKKCFWENSPNGKVIRSIEQIIEDDPADDITRVASWLGLSGSFDALTTTTTTTTDALMAQVMSEKGKDIGTSSNAGGVLNMWKASIGKNSQG